MFLYFISIKLNLIEHFNYNINKINFIKLKNNNI